MKMERQTLQGSVGRNEEEEVKGEHGKSVIMGRKAMPAGASSSMDQRLGAYPGGGLARAREQSLSTKEGWAAVSMAGRLGMNLGA